MRRCLLSMSLLAVWATALPAQDKTKDKKLPGDEMIEKYLATETDKLSKKFLDGAKTLKEWQDKRPRLHQEYLDMLGLQPLPEKTPLKATITGTFEHQGVIIENLHFQSIPGLYVTCNYYTPKASRGRKPPEGKPERLPTILYVCGHSNRGRDGNKAAFQDHGMWFASNGYNCLVVDTLQLGEIPGVHHGTYGRPWLHRKPYEAVRVIPDDKAWERDPPEDKLENRWWWHSAGYCPSGVECWNGIRAIDYLVTRPEVDADRIGVTGISGGGAATFWIAAADDRVKVAVPVSGMSDLESYVKDKVINGHCDCMFLYNTYQWEWTTIAALVAPRPLLFANSDNDKIFPMDGNRRIMARLQKLYDMYGKSDLVEEYVSKGGHDYRPDLRVAIFKFINKHLKGDVKSEVTDADFAKIEGKRLRVFPKNDFPKDAINDKVDEVFVPRAKVELPEKEKFEEWRERLVNEIKKRSFPHIRRGGPESRGEKYGSGKGVFLYFNTEKDVRVQIEGVSSGKEDSKYVILFVSGPDPLASDKIWKTWKSLIADDSASHMGPRGWGISGKWTSTSPPNYVDRSHALLGQTVDEGRVWDVMAMAAQLQASKRKLVGTSHAGIIAAYAALFEPSIEEVVIIDPPKSHLEGPHFLGVLRVLDIPDALGLLAPRKLTIIGGRDPAFDRTEAIYRAAGAAEKLVRK